MISGLLVVEDIQIQFAIHDGDHQIAEYLVSDGPTGNFETKKVDAHAFMIALCMLLDYDGGSNLTTEEAYRVAESVQPNNPGLRFIP